jgi:hypothetical protein
VGGVGAPLGARGNRRGGFARPQLAALVVATSVAFVGGCGAGSGQTAGGRAALLATLENWSALETPVDQALGILTQECMGQHGLRYYPFAQAGQPVPEHDPSRPAVQHGTLTSSR